MSMFSLSERREDFIADQELWINQQRAGDGYTLALAVRKLLEKRSR